MEEEFIEYREWMLKDDLEEFNRELMRYLMWYNTERVHSGLGNVSPLEWICYKFYENSPQSKILWTHTKPLDKEPIQYRFKTCLGLRLLSQLLFF
ncbi:MAG: integrase core domain-containing protein [Caldimicrobium sp.]|nr:integrase core domain-containing protein [Caldimicrobium sp.]